jgi:hypothetical protein
MQRLSLAELGPIETVKGHKGKAEQRHDKTTGHVVFVSDGSHQFGQDRPPHDCHDNVGGGFFRPGAQAKNAEGKDCREHDGHEEITQENANDRQPAELEEDQQTHDHVHEPIEPQNLVSAELFEDGGPSETANEEAEKAHGSEVGGTFVAEND